MLQCGYGTIEFDSDQPDDLSMIFFGISKIISYQLSLHLKDKWHPSNPKLNLSFFSPTFIDSVNAKNAKEPDDEFKLKMSLNKLVSSKYSPTNWNIRYERKISIEGFEDILVAADRVDQNTNFAMPVNSIRRVSPGRITEVRIKLIDEMYKSLIIISEEINADATLLKEACEAVKLEPWFIEREMGEIVVTRGKNPRHAQLVGRWEPDHIYHTARIMEEGEQNKDVLFMIYWRSVGIGLLGNPGRLSWINRDTLKYIPCSQDNFRFAFKVDKGDVDFSDYFKPPQHRAPVFYSHISDEVQREADETNIIRLNY